MTKLFGLPLLCVLGLMAGGCSHGVGMSAYAGDMHPGYGHHAMVEEDDGGLPQPVYDYGGDYYRHEVHYRSRPHCPNGMHLTTKLGRGLRCVANDGRDVESEAAKEALAGCDGGHIESGWHWEGTQYVLQKRGVGCHRSR